MEWPNPQPGHQVIPINLKGHKVKCGLVGSLKARASIADVQNISSKLLAKVFFKFK